MTEKLIDYRDLIKTYDLSHHKRSANAYFSVIGPLHPVMRKPFAATGEAIEITAGIGVMLDAVKPFPGATILDFGCGGGWLTDILAMLGADAYGVDLAEAAIAVAQETFGSHKRNHAGKAHFRVFDGETLPFEDHTFDAIVCFDAFHHVHNPEQIISEFYRVLKPGGVASFHEPGPHHSTFAQSQMEMRRFGVIESDLIIEDIDRQAQSVGFLPVELAISIPHPSWVDLPRFQAFMGDDSASRSLLSRFRQMVSAFNFKRTLLGQMRNNFLNLRMFSLRKPGTLIVDSRAGRNLECEIKIMSVKKNADRLDFSLQIRNSGSATWLPSGDAAGNVNLAFKSYDANQIEIDDIRIHAFERATEAGTARQVDGSVQLKAGATSIVVDLVAEHVCWFEMLSSRVVHINLDDLK